MMHIPWVAVFLSLKVACSALCIDLVIGIPLSFLLARNKFYGKEIFDTILTLPMVMPPTVMGYYLLVALGHNSPLGNWLQFLGINLIFTWQSAVIAAVFITFPLVVNPSRVAFETINTRYEHVAQLSGISGIAIFFRIFLPLAWANILANALLAFARALGEFGATLMVAGSIPGKTQTMSTAIYEAVQEGNDYEANSLVILLSLICIFVLIITKYLSSRKTWARTE